LIPSFGSCRESLRNESTTQLPESLGVCRGRSALQYIPVSKPASQTVLESLEQPSPKCSVLPSSLISSSPEAALTLIDEYKSDDDVFATPSTPHAFSIQTLHSKTSSYLANTMDSSKDDLQGPLMSPPAGKLEREGTKPLKTLASFLNDFLETARDATCMQAPMDSRKQHNTSTGFRRRAGKRHPRLRQVFPSKNEVYGSGPHLFAVPSAPRSIKSPTLYHLAPATTNLPALHTSDRAPSPDILTALQPMDFHILLSSSPSDFHTQPEALDPQTELEL
jgi:hypothetical protein